MITSIVFAALLMQDPKAPELLPQNRPPLTFAERLRGGSKNPLFAPTVSGVAVLKSKQEFCSTMVVIPADPKIDPKMAIQPKDQPNMPLFAGNEPCYNKLP